MNKNKNIFNKENFKILIKICFVWAMILVWYKFLWGKSAPISRTNKYGEIAAIIIQLIVSSYIIISSKYKKLRLKYSNIVVGALIGLSVALVSIGLDVLNPKNISWIMSETDRRQHFIGWNFYLNDQWHFPIGYYDNWGAPTGMSIIFTDSIPILAIIFKLFKPLLPSPFQYLGLCMFISFIMMGVLSVIVTKKFTDKLSVQAIVSIFLMINPLIFLRVTGHTSLTSQWLILWAIYLLINEKYRKKDLVNWLILILLSLSIHPYLLFMVYIIYIIYLCKGCFLDRNIKISKAIVNVIITFLSVIFVMYLLGYFKVNADILEDPCFGLFSFNLNGFINPLGFSKFIRTPLAYSGQYEGMAYLGVGGIVLVILAIIDLIRDGYDKSKIKLYITLIITIVVFIILSLSNMITFYGKTLCIIPLPKIIKDIWCLMRATGRMVWPAWYIIVIWSFYKVIKSSKKNPTLVVAILLIIQLLDLSEMQIKIRTGFNKQTNWQTTLKSEFWSKAKEEYTNVATTKRLVNEYSEIAYFASNNNMTMEYGYFARNPREMYDKMKSNAENLKKGIYSSDTLYILNNDHEVASELQKKHGNLVKQVDGYIVFSPKGFFE